MTLYTLCFAVFATVSAGCSVFSGEAFLEEMPSDISVEELLARREASTDPSGAYKNADTFFQRQVVSRDSGSFFDGIQKVIIETRFQKPDKFKITTIMANEPVAEIIFDGEKAVSVDYRQMTATPITGVALDTLRTSFVFGNAGTDLRSVFSTMDISVVTFKGEEFYRLKCTSSLSEQVPVFEVFIDAQDYLTRSFRAIPNAGSEDIYMGTIDTYANYDDVFIPERCSIRTGREKAVSQIVIFKLNAEFPADEFDFPIVAEE